MREEREEDTKTSEKQTEGKLIIKKEMRMVEKGAGIIKRRSKKK